MPEDNLFTMLSAYRPGSRATPFENYCTTALAYFLQGGHRMLTALFRDAAGVGNETLAIVEVQPRIAEAGIADLLLTFEGGKRALIEVEVEPATDRSALAPFEAVAREWAPPPALVLLGLDRDAAVPAGWHALRWLDVVEALDDDPDPVARQLTEFILRDIVGVGPVPLEQAIATNRLYALGGNALRRRYGQRVSYVNSASRPTGGHYRYLGTTFALDGGEMAHWIGIVNETVPLSEHYHLMLASKSSPVDRPASHPRATGDWKWRSWTGLGRVVRPITVEAYDELLARLDR